MAIRLERVYDESGSGDYRVLVDRIWPRGFRRNRLPLTNGSGDCAVIEAAQGLPLGDVSWDEFRRSYLTELKDHRDTLRPLAERASRESVTLLYSAKDDEHNNAVVLKQYLSMLE